MPSVRIFTLVLSLFHHQSLVPINTKTTIPCKVLVKRLESDIIDMALASHFAIDLTKCGSQYRLKCITPWKSVVIC